MTTTLVLPGELDAELSQLVGLPVEGGGVLLCGLVSEGKDLRLLGREFLPVADEAYEVRERDSLQITSAGYVPALGRAEADGAVPVWVHTHPVPGFSPRPSRFDDVVDEQLADPFRLRSGSEFYGSLVLNNLPRGYGFTGFVESETKRLDIDRVLSVGPRIGLTWSFDSEHGPLPPEFDRNVRAFGGDVQRILGDLRVAVVGCGGTGSAVVEQLARLGVRRFLLLDPDKLSDSNVTRVYGSGVADVGSTKTRVAESNIHRIAPSADVECLDALVTMEDAARRLGTVDVVFGCTDDNAGRLVLSRAATYLLVPVIDCGVLLTSDDAGELTGIFGRVSVLTPGSACLVCRGRVDLARAGAELLTPTEREHRVGEGYAPALDGVEPAVVAYTTAVASAAVGELLERLVGYGGAVVPSELLLRMHERETSGNHQPPTAGHYCDPAFGKVGRGSTKPFLEQNWQG